MTPLRKNTRFKQLQCFIKPPFTKQYDKYHESDQQMLQRVGKRFAVLFVIIVMFDTLLDWFLGLIDLIMHLIHLIIQAIEYSLLISLEHLFHFDQQKSEMIIVNAAIIITIYLAYRLMLAAPSLTIRARQYFLSIGLRHIKQKYSYWQAMSLAYKTKWLSAYSIGTTCLVLFL